ncbi:phosphohistidine phosphatase [Loktanella fryxellensis]|uniref:Phosphohistidine phosphatase n=1 Tax=Loktanella fryxellensis TaxID=245187 RepID=A0A1H8A7N1_9RHOB|nr:histidine phosphatase family protein [Loktanella fryxellensis]SEM65799.1 phosphohistidine phosphatase [Loktanella fryxellensis]
MTLTLILLRHAKSGWDDPTLADHDRTLNARGRRDAPALGHWLAAQGHLPDLILCSDAERTTQTVDLMLTGARADVPVRHLPQFYNASPDMLLRHIRKQGDTATLLVCAHNPGIGELAHHLVTTAPDHARFADYPTAATTVITFNVASWADIAQGDCTAFVIPADLSD